MASLREMMNADPRVRAIVEDLSISCAKAERAIYELTRVKKSDEAVRLVRKTLAHQTDSSATKFVPEDPQINTGRVTVDAEGGEFVNVTLDEQVQGNNFDHVFTLFNLDPELYEIVDSTVRCSTWQQSKRLDNGDRDTVQLYSYSCRFKIRSSAAITEDEFTQRRDRVLEWKPVRRTPGAGLGTPSTLVINWADWQLGKSEGGGVAATEERVLESFQRCSDRLDELRRIGRNVEGVAIVNMGDPVEGCMGQYSAQLATVELTQRRQLTLAMDLFETGILNLASQADKCDVIGVLCNHGEWNRVGNKQVTDDSDNAGGFLLDSVQRVLRHHPDMQHVEWTIPHDEMIVMRELSGVWNAFTHGHKMPSGTLKAEESWLAQQSLQLLRTYGAEPKLWTTAHKHHMFVIDLGPYHRIQCSALDGGSKWYTDASGKWSAPGTTTYLVGQHDVRGFSDFAVL